MQKCKYLDDLGLKIEDYGTNFCDDEDSRNEKWKKEREEYGFDERETWNLDRMFIEWIYTRIKLYQEVNCVDTSFYKFTYNGEELTQEQMMNRILCLAQDILLKNIDDNKISETMKEICDIWKEILPCMWW